MVVLLDLPQSCKIWSEKLIVCTLFSRLCHEYNAANSNLQKSVHD